jgi:hypothetical protein
MRSFVANAAVGIVSVSIVLVLIIVHEVLAAIAGAGSRFVVARRRLAGATAGFALLLAVLIAARFYYLRS